MDAKTGIAGTVIFLSLLVSLGYNIDQIQDNNHTHVCMNRSMTYHCDSFSKYYGLPNGKCINDVLSNKVCRSGWDEIYFEQNVTDITVINETIVYPDLKDSILVSDGKGLPFKRVILKEASEFGSMKACILNKTYCGSGDAKIYVSSKAYCNPIIGNETQEQLKGKFITVCNATDMLFIQNAK